MLFKKGPEQSQSSNGPKQLKKTKGKKTDKSKMSSVLKRTSKEFAIDLVRANERFIVHGNEGVVGVGLMLPVERIGGLNKKTKGEDQNGVIEAIESGIIEVLITAKMLEDEEIIFIPTQKTLANMGEHETLRRKDDKELLYDLVFFTNDFNGVEYTGKQITLSQAAAVAVGTKDIMQLLEDIGYAVLDNANESSVPDIEPINAEESDEMSQLSQYSIYKDDEVPYTEGMAGADFVPEVPDQTEMYGGYADYMKSQEVPDEQMMPVPSAGSDGFLPDAETAQQMAVDIFQENAPMEVTHEEIRNDLQRVLTDQAVGVETFDYLERFNKDLLLSDVQTPDLVMEYGPESPVYDYAVSQRQVMINEILKSRREYNERFLSVFESKMHQVLRDLAQRTDLSNISNDFGKQMKALRDQESSERQNAMPEIARRRKEVDEHFKVSLADHKRQASMAAEKAFRERHEDEYQEDLKQVETDVYREIAVKASRREAQLREDRKAYIAVSMENFYNAFKEISIPYREEQIGREEAMMQKYYALVNENSSTMIQNALSLVESNVKISEKDDIIENMRMQHSDEVERMRQDFSMQLEKAVFENESMMRAARQEKQAAIEQKELEVTDVQKKLLDKQDEISHLKEELEESEQKLTEQRRSIPDEIEKAVAEKTKVVQDQLVMERRHTRNMVIMGVVLCLVLLLFGWMLGMTMGKQSGRAETVSEYQNQFNAQYRQMVAGED